MLYFPQFPTPGPSKTPEKTKLEPNNAIFGASAERPGYRRHLKNPWKTALSRCVLSGLFSLGGNEDEALIQQRVVPDPVLEKISYQGTADIRVIVYRGEPIMAMLRLPTRASGGRANLHQGAIGAGVDIATGVTHHAVLQNRKAETHPDTNESVIGFRVPYWPEILEMSRKVSRAVEMGYIGVDIVLDRARGPLLLEANARPGLAIQISNARGIAPELARVDRLLGGAPAAGSDTEKL